MSRVRHEQQQEQPLPGDHQAVPALERGGLGEARRGSVEAADAAAEVGHGSRVWGGRRGGPYGWDTRAYALGIFA